MRHRHRALGPIQRFLLGRRLRNELDKLVTMKLLTAGTRAMNDITKDPIKLGELADELSHSVTAIFASPDFVVLRVDRKTWLVGSITRVHRLALSRQLDSLVPAVYA